MANHRVEDIYRPGAFILYDGARGVIIYSDSKSVLIELTEDSSRNCLSRAEFESLCLNRKIEHRHSSEGDVCLRELSFEFLPNRQKKRVASRIPFTYFFATHRVAVRDENKVITQIARQYGIKPHPAPSVRRWARQLQAEGMNPLALIDYRWNKLLHRNKS